MRGERRMRVFESRVLRRIFGSKRDEVTGEWRKQNNEELNVVHCSTNIVRVIKSRKKEMGGTCNACREQERRIQGFGVETGRKETTRETQA